MYKYEGAVYEVPFTYSKGKISVAEIDDYVRGKMKKISARLSCRVVGEEGEEY